MRNVNHNRPQLRLFDNLRRELGKSADSLSKPKVDETWPPPLRPVVMRRDSYFAFGELFEAIGAWFDADDESFSVTNFPDRLKKAARAFATVRIYHDYDNQYRGCDWIADLKVSKSENARAWGDFLSFFVMPPRENEG